MSFNNSLLTFTGMQESIEFDRQESLSPELFIRAVNKSMAIYQKAERVYYSKRYNKVKENITIDNLGYDLALITDLGSDSEGFFVSLSGTYQDKARLKEVSKGSSDSGYYIDESGFLFLNPEGGGSISIKYVKATTRYPLDTVMTTLMPIDQDAELLMEEFITSRFYGRTGQSDLQTNFEQRFYNDLVAFFKPATRTVTV